MTQAALELRATPQLCFLRTGLRGQIVELDYKIADAPKNKS
jgi:hypothetical protein